MRYTKSSWWIVLVAGGLALSACGGDEIECGEGTVEMDGTCVPESMVMCGDGTLNMDGSCVPDGSNCAEGTTYNDGTGECEPNIADCAPGTTAMGDECVPDGSVICTGNTTYDMETGTCVVTEDACAEGTTLIDGECVPNDETLMGEVFAAAEPDDPNFDGTPGDFLPPAIDEERTIEGCITPDDFDEDDTTDYDADWFEFSVADPGLFRIHADGLGGLSAAFAVVATDGPLVDQGFVRVGLNLVGDSSERRLYLPRAGNYSLIVFDSRSLNLDSLEEGVGFSRAVGNEDTCYFVTVEAEAVPSPTAITDSTASGTFGDPEFLSITASGDTVFSGELSEESNGVAGGLVLGTGDAASTGSTMGVTTGLAISSLVSDGSELLVVVDPVYDISMDPAEWDLTIRTGQDLPEGDITLTHDEDLPFGQFLTFEATAGDVAHLEFTTDGDEIALAIFAPDGTRGYAPCGTGFFGDITPCSSGEFWWVVEDTGRQIVQIRDNVDADDGDTYDVTFNRTVQTPPTLSSGAGMDVTLMDERTFVRVDTSSQIWTRFTTSGFTPAGFTEADIRFFADEPQVLSDANVVDEASAVSDSFSRIYGTDMGSALLMEIVDPAGFDGDESVNVLFEDETFVDVMVDSSTPVSRTGDTVPADGTTYYFVRAVPFGDLTFTVDGASGVDVVIDELDDEALSVSTTDEAGPDDAETFEGFIPSRGWMAFAVSAGSAGGMVDVSIEQTAPPYSVSPGTSSFATICPDGGGSGTEVIAAGTDDALSDATTFSSFTSFSFFGSGVSGYRVSTNGWMTFDDGYSGDSRYINEPLGTAGAPELLVAPLWRDLIAQVCVEESASQLIVEWNGQGNDFFGIGAFGTVQMQAIFLGDGSVEFVYGPMHDVTRTAIDGATATIGLENGDGSIGIDPMMPISGGSSVQFTPAP
ncbi:MAG TPA: hypothetical protein RMH99_15460 [Sandaracinaceae bacterium LLY-WYZ-13_1]|nr:hypothetical protein [Sandaracinaceae bacterium LLY-WYZ-13_1]